MLCNQRSKEEKEFRNLIKYRTKIQEEHRSLIQIGQDSKHLIHQLRGKVKRWNAVIIKNNIDQENKQELQQIKANKKQELQHKTMLATIQYKKILPISLRLAEQELTILYKSEENQQKFLKKIFKRASL